jgi:hypothetical protein
LHLQGCQHCYLRHKGICSSNGTLPVWHLLLLLLLLLLGLGFVPATLPVLCLLLLLLLLLAIGPACVCHRVFDR